MIQPTPQPYQIYTTHDLSTICDRQMERQRSILLLYLKLFKQRVKLQERLEEEKLRKDG